MTKNIEITTDNIRILELVHDKLQEAAHHMIQQNYLLIMKDLGKAKEDSEDNAGKVPVTISFELSAVGKKIFIAPSIEWKTMKKSGDSMDRICLDPDQQELPL
jgi:hypothetical protein